MLIREPNAGRLARWVREEVVTSNLAIDFHFYMATGFHGFHVFVGTIALFISFIRVILNHFTNKHHFGFESAIWYWHFVDVVWLFLFINVYWWSNK